MNRPGNTIAFSAQMQRIHSIARTRAQAELVQFFGIRQSSISDAERRGVIPPERLEILRQREGVNPEWILTGNGPCFLPAPLSGSYETGEEAAERRAAAEFIRNIPARLLADELVRRAAEPHRRGEGAS